jgi:[acyl-carrier-protein] S-malonyltransferase
MNHRNQKTIALLFPGQGSQYVGMGSKLKSKELFKHAQKFIDYDLMNLCLNGPEEELKLTFNTQPALFCHSVSLWKEVEPVFKELNVNIDFVLGHSVGEYAALCSAGALSFEDGLKAVRQRGFYMQKAVPAGQGKMFALIRAQEQDVLKACEMASDNEHKVWVANYNEPEQLVISGHAKACQSAVEWLQTHATTKIRAIELAVSAPFHCPLMSPAAAQMKDYLKSTSIQPLKFSYIANIDAEIYGPETSLVQIKENLAQQIVGSVRWTQSIQALPNDCIAFEVGPGKVLSGLIRKINPTINVVSLDGEDPQKSVREVLK